MTTIKDFMKEIKNDAEYLHIYDTTGAELDKNSTTLTVKTGLVVKLIVGDNELDTCTVCVRGDGSDDGFVTAVDTALVKNSIVDPTLAKWYQKIAMDMNYDDFLTAVDTAQIKMSI